MFINMDTDKNIYQRLRNSYNENYWINKPEELEIGEILMPIQSTKDFQISVSSGYYTIHSEKQSCIIREITGQNLVYFVANELKTISILQNYRYFAEVFGWQLEIQNDILKYTLVSKNYQLTLEDIKKIDETLKLKLIRQLVKGLKIMIAKKIYHGYISPFNLNIDELGNLRIQNFLLSGMLYKFEEDYCKVELGMQFLYPEFSSPEVRFAKKCYDSGISLSPYDPEKADLFSLGLTILSLFTDFEPLNEINTCLDDCAYKFSNRSETTLFTLMNENAVFKKLDKELRNLQKKIRESVYLLRDSSNFDWYILMSLLSVYQLNRSSTSEFYDQFKKSLKTYNSKTYLKKIRLKPFKLTIDSKFEAFIDDFIFFLNVIEDPLFNKNNSYQKQVNNLLLRLNQNFKNQLDELEDSYIKKDIGSKIDICEGLAYFFKDFLKNLNNPDYLSEFLEKLQSRKEVCDYSFIFNCILTLDDDIVKDSIISSLTHLKINKNQWFFYFPSSFIFPKYLCYQKFNHIDRLTKEFMKIISYPSINSVLNELNSSEINIVELFENFILDSIYLVSLPEGLCGFVTLNLRIFIKNYALNGLKFEFPRVRAAIYVTLIHELAHYLRRQGLIKRKEFLEISTPPSEIENTEAEKLFDCSKGSSRKFKNIKGEAGYAIEMKLFGERVRNLNDEAGQLLLDLGDSSIEDFKKKFKKINENNSGDILILKRDDEFIQLYPCPIRSYDNILAN